MRNFFYDRRVHCFIPCQNIKFSRGFSFEAVYCFICSRQRVTVARYRMICLVLILVDGGWGNWRQVFPCSATCGGGVFMRGRLCNSPKPAGGGKDCVGSSHETATCNTDPCPGKNVSLHYDVTS